MAFRILLVHALLIVGSLVFIWPFLWMAAALTKLDLELFGETLRLLPERPIPRLQSPYVDDRLFADLQGPRLKGSISLIEQELARAEYPWPHDLDRALLQKQTARGIYARLLSIVPASAWELPNEKLRAELKPRISPGLIASVVESLRRSVQLDALRVQSYDQDENLLIPAAQAATAWKIDGDARAQLVQPAPLTSRVPSCTTTFQPATRSG